MKNIFYILALLITGCGSTKDPFVKQARLLQKGKLHDDTSYVYALPYARGTSHRVIQGYFSAFSHKHRAAIDFKMKRGTEIFAARGGVIVRVKEDGDRGGWNKKYRPYGNMVVVEHADGTRAGYWHIKKDGALVNVGDTVQQGQLIALSGKTGYTATPHLHFLVWRFTAGNWQQVTTRFQTAKGIKYLRPLRKYRNSKP